jgi:5-methylthioadenosine/S-adenosylhomocysteine deaminase
MTELGLGEPAVHDGWMKGRAVVLAGAGVITMGPDGDLVGDIVVRDGRVVAVGVDAGAASSDDALRIDASGAVVIPGLVDGHVHAWEGALRGVSPSRDRLLGLIGTSPEELRFSVQLAVPQQ